MKFNTSKTKKIIWRSGLNRYMKQVVHIFLHMSTINLRLIWKVDHWQPKHKAEKKTFIKISWKNLIFKRTSHILLYLTVIISSLFTKKITKIEALFNNCLLLNLFLVAIRHHSFLSKILPWNQISIQHSRLVTTCLTILVLKRNYSQAILTHRNGCAVNPQNNQLRRMWILKILISGVAKNSKLKLYSRIVSLQFLCILVNNLILLNHF